MKLTVSSTVMMKPLLHVNKRHQHAFPPRRVVGLLESDQQQLNHIHRPQSIVQYSRPNQQQALQNTAKWQDFLQLEDSRNISCTAVFGFEFDGTNTWYRVWNQKTEKACWLLHKNNINYQAYAILTMHALVSLLPNWDGTLHQSPDTTDNRHVDYQKPATIDSKQISNLLVSDASTSTSGKLWFLVTIYSPLWQGQFESNTIPTRSGWIAPQLTV